METFDEKDIIVWVKDTEIERNMKTGEIITWQHEVKLNDNGLVLEDLSTDSNGNNIILRYRYDEDENCIWNCRVDTSGYSHGQLQEYDPFGNITLEANSSYAVDEEELQEIVRDFESEIVDVETEQKTIEAPISLS